MFTKIIIIALGILVILVYAFLIMFWKKSAKEMYEEDYIYLRAFLLNCPATESNFYHILEEFRKLTSNNKDKKKTFELWEKFCIKYDYQRKKIYDTETNNYYANLAEKIM